MKSQINNPVIIHENNIWVKLIDLTWWYSRPTNIYGNLLVAL